MQLRAIQIPDNYAFEGGGSVEGMCSKPLEKNCKNNNNNKKTKKNNVSLKLQKKKSNNVFY